MTGPSPTRAARAEDPAAAEAAKHAINQALELFQRRWTLRILWELDTAAALNFRALQAACGDLSASVMNQRLADLRDALLVERGEAQGYQLTAQGVALMQAVRPLLRWAPAWAAEVQAASRAEGAAR